MFSHSQPSWHYLPKRLQNSTWQEILNGKTNKTRCNENLSFCSKMSSHRKTNAITGVNIALRRTEQLCTEHTWEENFELQARNLSQKFQNFMKIASRPFKSYSQRFSPAVYLLCTEQLYMEEFSRARKFASGSLEIVRENFRQIHKNTSKRVKSTSLYLFPFVCSKKKRS